MSETFLIAEIGVNHDGELSKAIDLIDVASEAGADAVKFQTFNSESLSTSYAKKASYQEIKTWKELTDTPLSSWEIEAIKRVDVVFMGTMKG